MALTIYRRHGENCGVHQLKLTTKEKRFYRDCDCPIWMEGTDSTGKKWPRQAYGTRDWPTAEAKLRALTADTKDQTITGPKLSDCIDRYIESRHGEIGAKAAGQYRLTLGRLLAYATSANKFFIRELKVDFMEDFKVRGLAEIPKATSRQTAMAKVRAFLKEAHRRDWLTESLAEKVRPVKARYDQKQPYTEAEVEMILASARKLNGGTTGYATNATTFTLLLELMLETGMRVGDAVKFNPRLCEKSSHMWIYSFVPKKQKRAEKVHAAEVYISDRLKTAIDQCKWFSPSLPFAYREPAKDDQTDYLAQAVYERMQEIGKRCVDREGKPAPITDCRPHRLRDTFAVQSLQNGIGLEDVSKLLCHSSVAVTEKFYAAWVPARKLRLEKLLHESLSA